MQRIERVLDETSAEERGFLGTVQVGNSVKSFVSN